MLNMCTLLFWMLLHQTVAAQNLSGPVIKFETEELDYGNIMFGSDGTKMLKFKNIGSEPLIISECLTTCGCTIPTCPTKAILPGQTDSIKVVYDTEILGAFLKSITVNSNDSIGSSYIMVKGKVIDPNQKN